MTYKPSAERAKKAAEELQKNIKETGAETACLFCQLEVETVNDMAQQIRSLPIGPRAMTACQRHYEMFLQIVKPAEGENSGEIELPKLECLRCGHKWSPRSPRKPQRCAKCNNPYWDRPRTRRYYDANQCYVCGKYETGDAGTPEGWFGVDEDGNKICDDCQ